MKPCCDWETFEESLKKVAEDNKFPEILLDWKKARRCWSRYCMTGFEAFMTITKFEREQLRDVTDAEFTRKINEKLKRRGDGDNLEFV